MKRCVFPRKPLVLLVLPMMLLMFELTACGRLPSSSEGGSASLRNPNGFILDYDPQSGNAVTPQPDQKEDTPSAPGERNGEDTSSGSTSESEDTNLVSSSESKDTNLDSSSESKEEALNRILDKVENREPLSASEIDQYQEHQQQVERIREKIASGEALTAYETRVIGEENRRIAERTESTTQETTKVTKPPSPTPAIADWSIRVDDTRSVELAGLTWHMNLYVSLDKEGGTDPSGSYQGKMLLTGKVDEADMIALLEEDSDMTVDTLQQAHTTEAVSATLDVVPFDARAYDAFLTADVESGSAEGTSQESLPAAEGTASATAPATERTDSTNAAVSGGTASATVPAADWMATGSPEMVTRFQISSTGHDSSGNDVWGGAPDMGKKANVPVRILVRGADVEVFWGRGDMAYRFTGTLVGNMK